MGSKAHSMDSEAHIGLEARVSSSGLASSYPFGHTGHRTGSFTATRQSSSRRLHGSMSNSHPRSLPSLPPRLIGTIVRTPTPTTRMSNSAQGDGSR
jgi:hypothetical protein